MKQTLELEITGDGSKGEAAIGGVGAKTIALGNLMADAVKAGVEVLTKAVEALGAAMIQGTMDAAEAQKGQVALGQAFATAGTYTKQRMQAAIQLSDALQAQTTFDNDAIIAAQKSFAVYGFQGKQLEDLTRATLDLATAKKMDLESAANLVAKSVGTETNALGRLGVQLDDTTDKNARAEQAVKALGGLFGGQASAQAQTFGGRLDQMKNLWGDLLKELGGAVVNNKAVQVAMEEVKKVLIDLTTWVTKHRAEIAELVKVGILTLINAFIFLINVIDVGQRAWNELGNLFLWVGQIFEKIVKFFAEGIAMIADGWYQLIDLASRVIPGLDGVKEGIKAVRDGAKETAQSMQYMIEATDEEIAMSEKSADARSTMLQGIVSGAEAIARNVGAVKAAYVEAADVIDEAITKGAEHIEAAADEQLSLIELAQGYTAAELAEYDKRKIALEQLVEDGKITSEQYYAFLDSNAKKFNDTDALLSKERKDRAKKTMDDILALSTAQAQAVLSGQKNLGTAMEDAAKASARTIIDTEIDKAIAAIGITEALEMAKATMGGFLSFGATLLALPLIAAAATAAKAIIHGVVGFAEGGIIGQGGTRIPLPGIGGSATGAPTMIMAHEGEMIGTPERLAGAGIGGIVVNVAFAGGLSGGIEADAAGEIIGAAILDKMRGNQ